MDRSGDGDTQPADRASGDPRSARQPLPPASVREVMKQPRPYRAPGGPARTRSPLKAARQAAQARPDTPLSREVEVERETWTVRVTGTSSVATGGDAGPRLLHLSFAAPGDRPNPDRAVYVLARGIDEIPEAELAELVADVQRDPGATSAVAKGRGRGASGSRPFRRRRRATPPRK